MYILHITNNISPWGGERFEEFIQHSGPLEMLIKQYTMGKTFFVIYKIYKLFPLPHTNILWYNQSIGKVLAHNNPNSLSLRKIISYPKHPLKKKAYPTFHWGKREGSQSCILHSVETEFWNLTYKGKFFHSFLDVAQGFLAWFPVSYERAIYFMADY